MSRSCVAVSLPNGVDMVRLPGDVPTLPCHVAHTHRSSGWSALAAAPDLLRITVTLQDELVSGIHLDLVYLEQSLMLESGIMHFVHQSVSHGPR